VLYNSYTGYTVILAIRTAICVSFAVRTKFHKKKKAAQLELDSASLVLVQRSEVLFSFSFN